MKKIQALTILKHISATAMACLALLLCQTAPAQTNFSFTTVGSLTTARYTDTATLLPNGQVLVAGGYNGTNYLSSAEVFNPATGTWTPTGSLNYARELHTATLLTNGLVLVAGGVGNSGTLTNSELYNPATGTWTTTGSLNTARYQHTATLLTNGLVLVAGGNGNSGFVTNAETFNPATGTWSTSGSLNIARSQHTATLLTNGLVLVAGGYNGTYLTNGELYNPATRTWALAGPLNYARGLHTAILLTNGLVLVAGGYNGAYLTNAELYNPGTGTWTTTGSLNTARSQHTATLMPNGLVLIAGGFNLAYLSSTELYNTATGTWTLTGSLNTGRKYPTATLLPSGQVLIAAGDISGGVAIASSELAVPATNSSPGTWTTTNSLNFTRDTHTATLLTNGQVLIAGGSDGTNYLSSSEVFNPATGTWTTNTMNSARYIQTATLLTNGMVLAAGGENANNSPISSAELFNSMLGTWTPVGSMTNTREGHTATLLTNGLVLVAGGFGNTLLSAAELFNPVTETWTPTGSMNIVRENAAATLLTNGLVLVAGGYGNSGSATNSAEIYNPVTGTWTLTGSMTYYRQYFTATLLPNGQVLVAGGSTGFSNLNSAELYNPATGLWQVTAAMHTARQAHTATLLPNGLVLVAGGYTGLGTTNDVELYNPAVGTWTVAASLNTARFSHSATLLTNGQVLVAGGDNNGNDTTSAELYNVGLGFSASSQPQITSITSPLNPYGYLSITGSRFRGISEGSSGNGSQDSPADYPVVQLMSLESGQTQFLPTSNWSTNSYTSEAVTNFPPGYAMVTAFVNGIPSAGTIISVGLPAASFTYTTNGGTVTLTGYSGPSGAVTIPTTNASGLPVTAIGTNVFYDFTGLTSVTISSNITNLGNFAFYGCTNLTSIYFQGNAPTYGSGVFVNDNNATVFYSSGTSGWSSTFDGLPAQGELTLANIASFSIFPNGAYPLGSLVQGSDGTLYGTTSQGSGTGGDGTVFKVTTNGILTNLWNFTGSTDGGNPRAGLVLNTNDGNLYGTTSQGGTNGLGNIFKITTNGAFTVLHSFTNSIFDGEYPVAAPVVGTDGNLYGTTFQGGPYGIGIIFKITTTGAFTNLHSFRNEEGVYDGEHPGAALVQGPNGNLYGTASGGGASNRGTIFSITTNGTFTNLHAFGSYDGEFPNAALALGSDGSFYGTTYLGGTNGLGNIFKITTNGTFTTLHSFVKGQGGQGFHPQAGLVQDTSNGNFYGTTVSGGTGGFGIVFQMATNGVLTTLYPFGGTSDGANPAAALVQGIDGKLYGTAEYGGVNFDQGGNGTIFSITTNGTFASFYQFPGLNTGTSASALAHTSGGNFYGTTAYGGASGGNGTVFKITTNGLLTTFYAFTGGNDGANPLAALVQGIDGNGYGTASAGGSYFDGTVFQITANSTLNVLYTFTGASDGSYPNSALVPGGDGNFYGTTSDGDGQNGTIFKVSPNGDFNTLYSFTNGFDGSEPNGVTMGVDGNFYGTTYNGGDGYGSVFVMTPGGALTVLYYFTGDNDGGNPLTPLVQGGDGNFYGTTSIAGTGTGNGTIFKITPGGSLTTLYSFGGITDGSGDSPSALLAGTDGNFYGTTSDGGTNGVGTIFVMTPGGSLSNLYSFTGSTFDGGSPMTSLVQGGDGSLYGPTSSGAVGGNGGIFRLSGGDLPSPLPVVTVQPASPPSTLVGLSAAFTVNVLGGPPFGFQWLQNGVPLSEGGVFYGLNIGTLTVDPVSLADAGNYSVIVSNSYGITTSSGATLNVFDPTNAMEDFEAGTNYLAVDDLVLADLSFYNALNSSVTNATNATYNFFYAMTEVFSLPDQPAGSNFLNRLGVGSLGRDIYKWEADKPTNAKGHLEIPNTSPPLNVDEFTAELRTNALPAIIAAEGNLGLITNTNFSVALTTNETHSGPVTVDWGDVEMLESMGNVAELFIYTTYSWNLDVQLDAATNYFGKDGNIEAFLANYTNFLTTTSTADLPAAKGAFTNAINEYFIASQFIRNPSRPAFATPHLFDLDPSKAQEELEFRETLSNLLASLSGPVALTTSPNNSVSAQAFFDGSFSPRSYLPEFQNSEFVWDTFPQTNFGGIIGGLNESQDSKGFLKLFKKHHLETTLDLPGTSVSVLYNFTNFSDQSGVVQGPDGNLYGTLMTGGPYIDEDSYYRIGYGSVFKVTTNGQFSILYNFGTVQDQYGDPLDGAYPNALIFGNDGELYGTAQAGGTNGTGTVFKITTSGQLTPLYSFSTEADDDARDPAAALVQGTNGEFYGTTSFGGNYNAGTIFVISSNGILTNLYSFSDGEANPDNADGGYPAAAPLVFGTNGCLYGTTPQGGDFNYGTIFKINVFSDSFTTLYYFGSQQDLNFNPIDGTLPNGLVLGPDGNFYGTTQYGGANDDNLGSFDGGDYLAGNPSDLGDGTIFCITPGGSFSNVFQFDANFGDGYNPIGSLLLGPNGTFLGVASEGGANDRGAVFVCKPNVTESNLVWLDKISGDYDNHFQSFVNVQSYLGDAIHPVPPFLTLGNNGNLYCTTTDDGANGNGTICQFNLVATLITPTNGQSFSGPGSILFSASVAPFLTNSMAISFYTVSNGSSNLIGTAPQPPYVISNNFAAGTYAFTAVADTTNVPSYSYTSAVAYVTVNTPGTTLIDFDPLAESGPVEGGSALSSYLAQYGVTVTNNSPGTTVVAENQNQFGAAGGNFVTAASPPNVLTQIGSNGPVNFTVGFASLLTQFSFTRPQLLANPFVTHPAWQAQAFDAVGNLLGQAQEPQISSSTNVPAQTYTFSGDGIASIEFSSEGSGFTTFNAMLIDNFILTAGTSNTLLPSVLITSPTNGQIFTNVTALPISVETAAGTGTVTGVAFYYSGSFAGSATNSPFSIMGPVPTNGPYILTAVVTNNTGLISTSAPVSITVATGFGFETLPASQTVGTGNQATFSATTTDTGVSYQWQHNGTNIPGANLASYTVNNATGSTAGSYTVVAVNGNQTISSPPAVLTVLSPPSIGPITEMIANGIITLSVTVSDGTNFFTQWLHNGTGIANTTSNYPAGTATTSYSFPAQSFNSGSYEVVVANGVTSSNSLPFTVNLGPTTVTSNNVTFASSLAINPLNGAVAGITRNASSGPSFIAGKPAGGFLWYNWTPNVSGVIYLTTLGSSFDTLLGVYTGSYPGNLTKVAADDDSGGFFTSLVSFNFQSGTTYQIVVAGYKGATGNVVLGLSPGTNAGLPGPGSGFLITSQPAPVITQQPSNQIVNAGATVTLSVVASNAASYQWYFANVPVASASGGNMDPLIIPAFSTNAVGNYFVQVSNAVGIAQSAVATVQIQNANQTSGSQTNLALDKFGDSSDLTGANAPDHFRPEDGGGDTGGFTLSQAFSTVGATKEEGEPNHAGQPGGASYWYTYSSFSPGKLRFDTTNSAFNTILAVYVNGNPNAAASFGSLISVGSNFTTNFTVQGQPSVTISNAFPYPKYYIAIDGYQGASGAAFLNVFTTPNTNAIPVTNNPPVVAITSPANNFLATSSNITVKGTVKGIATVNAVQVAINTNAFGLATLTLGAKIFNWSTNVTLVPGANVITVQSITAEGTNTDIVSDPVTCTIFYDATAPSASIKAPLTLETNGSGKITGEANHASLEIGKIYKITATPTGNWVFDYWNGGTNTNSLSLISDSATFSFDMVTNLVLQANFVTNPFTAVAGVYNGLFSPPSGVTEESSGFLTVTLPATSRGAYSAKLLVDGGTYAFSGAFDLAGDAEETVARPGKTSLSVNLQLDLPATNDLMGGSVSEIATSGWTSEIVADRVTFNAKTHPATNYAGKYTLLIPPGGATNEPGGYGYATLANTLAGLVTVSGSLADKTAISQSVAVSKDGNIPLYVSLYTHKGSLLGWLTLTNQSPGHPAQTIVGAELAWIKTNLPKTLYAAGFTNTNLTAFGSFYTNGINFTNCTLTISNADLGGALTNSNVSLVDNKLVSTGSGTLSGTIKSSTGIVTVTFRPKDTSKSSVATGVVIQDTTTTTTNAAGWFLGPTQSGFFLLQQNP